jgi:hypothetical protein
MKCKRYMRYKGYMRCHGLARHEDARKYVMQFQGTTRTYEMQFQGTTNRTPKICVMRLRHMWRKEASSYAISVAPGSKYIDRWSKRNKSNWLRNWWTKQPWMIESMGSLFKGTELIPPWHIMSRWRKYDISVADGDSDTWNAEEPQSGLHHMRGGHVGLVRSPNTLF